MDATTTRENLIQNLNEDLSREYQAIIAYVVYSQVLKGAEYMHIAREARNTCRGGTRARPADLEVDPLPGRRPDRDTETRQTVRRSPASCCASISRTKPRRSVSTADAVRKVGNFRFFGQFAISEHLREILVDEGDHLIELATALGEEVPDVSDAGSQEPARSSRNGSKNK